MEVVDVYNMALAQLGHDQTVTATTDATAEASWCNRFYDQSRKECLRLVKPNFAVRTEALEDGAESDNPNWFYEFSRPTGCLGITSVVASDGNPVDYALQGELLFADVADVSVVFVFDEEDADLFDALFVAALAYKLASYVSLPLTGKSEYKRLMEQGFVSALSDARVMDANDDANRGEHKDHNHYVSARA
jgi:hypothetical protein